MTITNRLKITLTPLRLHSASSVRIPNSINNFRTLIPALRLRPLTLVSASSVNLHGLANTSIFHNNLRVMLSPLKSPVLRKYSNPFKRPGMYPSISKCNAKRCNCCMHLCTNSTVTSSVNGRKFSVVSNSDLGWKSIDLIYVLTWKTKNCNMQYVGKLVVLCKNDLANTIVEWKILNRLILFFISILNVRVIRLMMF